MKSLKEYPEYKDRVEYIEDRQKKTSILRLHNVTENDERVYYFRLITTEKEKWTGKPGIHLKVSGNPLHSFISMNNFISWSWLDRCVSPALQVKAPQLVMEKEAVNLTCETTCSLTDGFIWYKNGQTLQIQSKHSSFSQSAVILAVTAAPSEDIHTCPLLPSASLSCVSRYFIQTTNH